MWRLKLSIQNECVYVLKKLSFAQVRAQVEEMVCNAQKVSSGLIDESTKFVFRSRSAKFILLIQMSKEMWDFADDGDLYFEKAVNGFLKSLFSRWKSLSISVLVDALIGIESQQLESIYLILFDGDDLDLIAQVIAQLLHPLPQSSNLNRG
eukprot:gene7289-8471_t